MKTLGELRAHIEEFLRAHPEASTLPVFLEGCDCVGPWDGGISHEEKSPYNSEQITLTRDRT